ncbi:MAG: hypothetical protein ACXWPM_04375 [Bdellovibrionota bacterium]
MSSHEPMLRFFFTLCILYFAAFASAWGFLRTIIFSDLRERLDAKDSLLDRADDLLRARERNDLPAKRWIRDLAVHRRDLTQSR